MTRLDFLKSDIKKVVLSGRVKCGGTEGVIVVAHGCRKIKKLTWHGRGNSGDSWPPAFPRSSVRQVRLRQFLGRALPHLQIAVVTPRASRWDV